MNNAIIELRHITKKYSTGNYVQVVLEDLSYSFKSGTKTALLGSSGCGKTTLLNLIGGIDANFSGELLFNGQTVADFDQYRREHVSFIFQDLNLVSHLNLVQNITIGLTNDIADKEQKALQLLKRVGLKDHADKKPHQLSGGERQRVAVARALARDTDLLLCDEPTGSLDDETKREIMHLIVDVFQGKTIIFITHDERLAHHFSDITLTIKEKKLQLESASQALKNTTTENIINKQKPAKTFNGRFEINLLSKKLKLFNAAYLMIVISAIFLFGTGLISGVEKKIDNYLYQEYKVAKIDVRTVEYSINGFKSFIDEFNEQNDNQIIGYMTGAWLKSSYLSTGEEHYLFANTLQSNLKDTFESDIVYGRLPQNNNEILYSKGAAQKTLYQFYSATLSGEAERYQLIDRLTKMSDADLFNELLTLKISYKNAAKFNAKRAYDNQLVVVGLIDDLNYLAANIPFGGNDPKIRKYNVNSNTELAIEYHGETKQIMVNDNIYLLEAEFLNYIDDVYIGLNSLKLNKYSVFINRQNLDLRKQTFDALLLYKHNISGEDHISAERATYYDEVHGYKVAIVGGCLLVLLFAVISLYNGIKIGIDRNKVNIGIYKSLGYTSNNIRAMFFKEGVLMALFITVTMLIMWAVLTLVLSDYILNSMDLSRMINLGRVIHLDSFALFAVIFTMLLIILSAIAKQLSKISIVDLIKNK